MSATAERDGSAAPEARPAPEAEDVTGLPVDSFREAARYLRRPFMPNAVKFKVQTSGKTREGAGWAMIVAHIDARLVAERLNLVCPHLWAATYEPTQTGMWCRLTVDGITRTDFGTSGARRDDAMYGKALVSDALKRSAVMFGIGVSLYAVPRIFLRAGDGTIRPRRGDRYELTDTGVITCRRAYAQWLEDEGIAKFGRPLDHGDAEDAVGDHETETPQAPGGDGGDDPQVARDRFLSFAMDAVERGLTDRSRLLLALGAAGARDTSSVTKAAPTVDPAELTRMASELADLVAADDEARASARGADDGNA